jgi:glycosyltransferase involved in cell wall biosynthesis
MKSLSVIIPIYDVESYLERCLRSLEDQDISRDSYEVICINDGSTDNSRGIVIRMQKEFDNILLIDEDNQGVSRARNNGIDKASGKYVLFIDPDDYVDANSFGRILNNADMHDAEVSFIGFRVLNEDGTTRKSVLNKIYESKIYQGTEAYFIARGNGKTDPDRMWAVLFKTEFLNCNNLRFLPDVPYLEDGEFIARILCLTKRCIFDSKSFYQRTTRSGSATNSRLFHTSKATHGFLLAASNLKRFQTDQNLNEKQREFLNRPVVKFVSLALNSSIDIKSFRRVRTTMRDLKALGFKSVNLTGCVREFRIYGLTYNLSPYLTIIALLLYPRVERLKQLLIAN